VLNMAVARGLVLGSGSAPQGGGKNHGQIVLNFRKHRNTGIKRRIRVFPQSWGLDTTNTTQMGGKEKKGTGRRCTNTKGCYRRVITGQITSRGRPGVGNKGKTRHGCTKRTIDDRDRASAATCHRSKTGSYQNGKEPSTQREASHHETDQEDPRPRSGGGRPGWQSTMTKEKGGDRNGRTCLETHQVATTSKPEQEKIHHPVRGKSTISAAVGLLEIGNEAPVPVIQKKPPGADGFSKDCNAAVKLDKEAESTSSAYPRSADA